MDSIKKILILDDDAEILDLLQRILGTRYILLTKIDTENLEKDLSEFKPDVILIDHFIGNKTSLEIINKTLRHMNNIPVILHSAHDEIEKISIDARAAGFIKKPSSIHEIREYLSRILEPSGV